MRIIRSLLQSCNNYFFETFWITISEILTHPSLDIPLSSSLTIFSDNLSMGMCHLFIHLQKSKVSHFMAAYLLFHLESQSFSTRQRFGHKQLIAFASGFSHCLFAKCQLAVGNCSACVLLQSSPVFYGDCCCCCCLIVYLILLLFTSGVFIFWW